MVHRQCTMWYIDNVPWYIFLWDNTRGVYGMVFVHTVNAVSLYYHNEITRLKHGNERSNEREYCNIKLQNCIRND